MALDIKWAEEVADHDFDAAEAYLSILFDETTAKHIADSFRKGKVVKSRANDILRASNRIPLTWDDPGVRHTEAKVDAKHELSPILVVSFEYGADIADGYHRASLTYLHDPFGDVPCVIEPVHIAGVR